MAFLVTSGYHVVCNKRFRGREGEAKVAAKETAVKKKKENKEEGLGKDDEVEYSEGGKEKFSIDYSIVLTHASWS